MEKYNFCNDILRILDIKELNSKTLMYRINNFVYACNMNLDDGYYMNIINNKDYHFAIKEMDDYRVNISMMDYRKYQELKITGEYEDIKFEFINRYNDSISKNRNMEIPFEVELNMNDGDYILKIKSLYSDRVEFYFEDNTMDNDNYHFYANILDFSRILKLVKSFVENPKLVYDTYNEIIKKKEVFLNNTDIKKALVNDDSLDKPTSKIMKKIKILTNND